MSEGQVGGGRCPFIVKSHVLGRGGGRVGMEPGLVLVSLAGSNSCNPMIFLVKIIKELLLLFRYGQRETAGKIIEDMLATGDSNFNHLHKEVLLFNNENLRPFREISVRKKPWDNMQVSPGHSFFFF